MPTLIISRLRLGVGMNVEYPFITKRYRVAFSALYPLITVNAYSWLDHPVTPFIVAPFRMLSRLSEGAPDR